MKYIFQKLRETLPNVLTSSQTNLDGITDRVTSKTSERIGLYCNQEEGNTKIFVYIKFVCDNIRLNRVIIVSQNSNIAVISLYQSVTNLTFLYATWLKTGNGDHQLYTY